VNYLLDTHVLLWAAQDSLPRSAKDYFAEENSLYFSPASIWEVVIKRGLGRDDFQIDPKAFYKGLLAASYRELPITAQHALALEELPPIHKDPFDRILLAQAMAEKMSLITADARLSKYPKGVIAL